MGIPGTYSRYLMGIKHENAMPDYRFGFNGKEKDDEWTGSTGATYDYGFRIYDSRIARFLSVDPITKDYPELTPYQFASNTPIMAVDLDGLEAKVVIVSGNDVDNPKTYTWDKIFGDRKQPYGAYGTLYIYRTSDKEVVGSLYDPGSISDRIKGTWQGIIKWAKEFEKTRGTEPEGNSWLDDPADKGDNDMGKFDDYDPFADKGYDETGEVSEKPQTSEDKDDDSWKKSEWDWIMKNGDSLDVTTPEGEKKTYKGDTMYSADPKKSIWIINSDNETKNKPK